MQNSESRIQAISAAPQRVSGAALSDCLSPDEQRLHFPFCILHYRDQSRNGPPFIHQTDRYLGHWRCAGELRQSRERDHSLRAGRRHHAGHRNDEAGRVHAVCIGLRPDGAHDDGGCGRGPERTSRPGSHSCGEEARRKRRPSRESRGTVCARAGGDSGHLSPGPHHAALEAEWRARAGKVRCDLLGRRDCGARVAARHARGGGQPEVARVPDSLPSQPSERTGRSVPGGVWRPWRHPLRAVQRRCAAARQRAQLRPRAAADVRSAERAIRPQLRR